MALRPGVSQSRGRPIRIGAFCRRARYCPKVLPGLKVALRSCMVSVVGGDEGLPSRARKRM